ncbi:TetR/AcrR family transcriptional regulator [Candidatus Saccharibacteria bacterium]|nr:TetR/AcrR family transcriptional regulator [Candidatus Saccharibacteria bacterium]
MSKTNVKKQLIDAAYKVFVEKGFTDASIRDIAKEAGIRSGLVYYYFKTKDEILIAVQVDTQERYHQFYATQAGRTHDLRTDLHEIRSRIIDNPDWYRWRYELYALSLRRVDLQSEVASVLEQGRQSLQKYLAYLLPDDNNASDLAGILIACFDGLALQALVDDSFKIDEAYTLLAELIEIYVSKHTQEGGRNE